MPDTPTRNTGEPGADAAPLILTLAFDAGTFARFDGLRRRHFPKALNHIPAHATLFHNLPGAAEPGVRETIAMLARTVPPPVVAVTGLRFTGRGVAYVLESEALSAFRARLAKTFEAHLTAQDKQGWRPHVTVQNKVDPETARALHAALADDFAPFHFTAPATRLWRYLGGPWAERAQFAFGENA
ncbi:2'-5' RNA ligase family protein [Methylobacterium sp. WL103]|uniref:2'-5' RNA ligase family protein n=1 Tax=unclassified Methylobacterium TaxID=2615210 RepID=UPI0011C8E59F|nr:MULTISPECIES: 2'-5' RNA ligase family protein [unclassified Methylobacterium]TXM73276.1 2'-5' RNA ligase family protein [Methylobacterium sp. WL12]TXM93675.1 2'-5' RNA ligase family protein [Methylobacterium sp. WL103]